MKNRIALFVAAVMVSLASHAQFEADKFLTLMRLLGKLIHADVLKSLTKLSSNYHDVKVGFDFKLVR